jgi:hypothetical protein
MDKKTRNILIGAGVLGLLFFLSRRKKAAPVTVTKTGGDSKASNTSVDVKENDKAVLDLDEKNKMEGFLNANGTYTYQITSTPDKGGSASLQGSVLTYSPAKDFVGTELVKYQILDSDGAGSNIATITFNVTPVYDGASAKNISQSVTEDGSVTFDIASSGSGSGTGAKDSGTSDAGTKDSSGSGNKGFAPSTDTFAPKGDSSSKSPKGG